MTQAQPLSRGERAFSRALDAGMRLRLSLVLIPDRLADSAPAGGPDLTSLERWCDRQDFPVQQVHLAPVDAQPNAFLDRLARALDGVVQLNPSPGVTVEDRAIDLVNAVLDVPRDFALLIFGYDAIQSGDVHSLLSRILDYQPPQLHLYLVVSASPPLPCLPRMRVRRQVQQVSWPDKSVMEFA